MDLVSPALLKGTVHVAFAVNPDRTNPLKLKLKEFFTESSRNTESLGPWQAPVVEWSEKEPANRFNRMRDALGGWSNDDQLPILQSTVKGMAAELHEGDILPFRVFVAKFSIELSKETTAHNSTRHLLFVAQKCRDFAGKMTDLHGGETVVVTSEVISVQQMSDMRADLDNMRSEGRNKRKARSPLTSLSPLGLDGGEGFSHFLIALNLHTVIAPFTSHSFGGPGWLIHVYERADPYNPPSWGSNALSLVDPVLSDWTSFVEQRPGGLPFLLASWHWFQSQRHDSRTLLAKLSAEETPIRRLGSVLNFRTWWRLRRNEDDARKRVHGLKILLAEYDAALSAFVASLRREPSREVWIPPPGSIRRPEVDSPGLIEQMITDFLRQLRQTAAIAAEGWEMAKAQRETHTSRVELALGIAVLLLTIVQVGDLITRWSGG